MDGKKILSSIPPVLWQKIYLVGGFLRDLLLGKKPSDIDLVVDSFVLPLAKEISISLGGTLVVLDRERDTYRVALSKKSGSVFHIDLQGAGDGGIYADLKRRDFTINAMAISLSDYLNSPCWDEYIIDPLGGLADLARGIIRVCSHASIEDDPIRALRAFRLSAKLGFTLEPGTLKLIKEMQRSITTCSGERIWCELATILLMPISSASVRLMDAETGLLDVIFPETVPLKGMEQGGYHVDDAWKHSIKTLECFEEIINQGIPPEIQVKTDCYLEENITKQHSRLPVLKLACLIHDVGKQFCRENPGDDRFTFYGHDEAGVPVVQEVASRLKMSSGETKLLAHLVASHMEPLYLYNSISKELIEKYLIAEDPSQLTEQITLLSPRALRRFFVRVGNEVVGVLLLSLSDIMSVRTSAGNTAEALQYQNFIFYLLQIYLGKGSDYTSPPKLLNGNDISRILNIKPSPLVGRALKELAEAQVERKITTTEDAEKYVKEWAKLHL